MEENKKPSNPRMQAFDGIYASDAYKQEDYVSLRDHFAGLVIQGIVSKTILEGLDSGQIRNLCINAYNVADAMLKERELTNH